MNPTGFDERWLRTRDDINCISQIKFTLNISDEIFKLSLEAWENLTNKSHWFSETFRHDKRTYT